MTPKTKKEITKLLKKAFKEGGLKIINSTMLEGFTVSNGYLLNFELETMSDNCGYSINAITHKQINGLSTIIIFGYDIVHEDDLFSIDEAIDFIEELDDTAKAIQKTLKNIK